MTLAGQILRGWLTALCLAWTGWLAYVLLAPRQGWPPLPSQWTLYGLAGLAVLMLLSALALVLLSRRTVDGDAEVLVAVAGKQAGACRKRLVKALGDSVVSKTLKAPKDVEDAWELFSESEAPVMVWRPADGTGVLMVADLPWLAELAWPPRQPNALQLPMLPVEAWGELGLFVRGLAEFHAGDAMRALETWGGLDALAEASAIWQGLAWESLENLEAARDWYASIDLAEARVNLARCHTLLGETDAAIAVWQEVLRAEPGCGAARYWLGSIYRDLGRPKDAVSVLQPADDADAPACWTLAGDILGEVGAWGLAAKAYRQALDETEDDGELWRRYGQALEEQGRLREAIEATERSVEIEPSAANLTQWGRMLGQLGRWESAMPLFERAHELDDEYPEALHRWAQALEELYRLDEAVSLYAKLLTLHPGYTAARMSLATLLARRGDINGASGHFQSALANHPMPADVHLRWATALSQGGQWREAIEHLEEVIRLDPRCAQAYHYLGLGLIQLGRTQEALRFFRRAYELEPTRPEALIDWGIALGQLGHMDKALARFEEALRLKPGHPRAMYNLAVVYDRLHRYEEAVLTYRQILDQNPDDAQAHYDLGRSLKKLGRTEEALVHTQQALRLMDAAGTPLPQ